MIMALYIVVVFYTQGISFGAYQNVKKYSGKNGLYIGNCETSSQS